MLATKSFSPTPAQTAIFQHFRSTNDNIVVLATAGAGKTTTLLELLSMTPLTSKTIFVAFSKAIAEELAHRAPSHIKVSTLHSLGLGCIRKTFGFNSVIVDPQKTRKFVDSELVESFPNPKKRYRLWMELREVLDFCRLHYIVDFETLFSHPGIDHSYEILARGFELHMKLLTLDAEKTPSPSNKLTVDFSAMVFMPAMDPRILIDQYDNVLVDECQDLTPVTRTLVLKITGKRFVAVGDPNQAIFLFMGSDSQSFKVLQEQPNTVTLPLTTSFRCAKNIVEIAQRYSNDIQPSSFAVDGIVRTGSVSEAKNGDLILCRTNKPLITTYLQLLRDKIPCHIKDDDLGARIFKLIEKHSDPKHPGSLISNLNAELDNLCSRLIQRGISQVETHPKYLDFVEIIDIIQMLANHWGVENLSYEIGRMFKNNPGATLMSIHKSKGLEADRVFIVRWDLIPHSRATTVAEKLQEKNLQFVATTRAKNELIFDHEAGH